MQTEEKGLRQQEIVLQLRRPLRPVKTKTQQNIRANNSECGTNDEDENKREMTRFTW